MALPAYDQCIKASHVFNLLDARGVISVTELQTTSCGCANWQKPAAMPGFTPKRAGRSEMPDLLLELFSEEIPARMQAKAADDLRRMVTDKLVAEGLGEGAKASRRRAAGADRARHLRGNDSKTERRGPENRRPRRGRAGLPESDHQLLDEATIQRRPEGRLLCRADRKAGRATIDVLAEILPVIRTFPWPKSMRWGERSAKSGCSPGCAAALDHRDLRARDRRA